MVGTIKRMRTRLEGYDYSRPGVYFITICTNERKCLLSEIVGEGLAPPVVRLTDIGKTADEQIRLLPARFPVVAVEKYVIMQNHIHLLLKMAGRGGASPSPTVTIPDVICVLKSQTSRLCGGGIFQRSFHDHIVRNEGSYQKIWNYIDTNPAKWTEDCFYCGKI